MAFRAQRGAALCFGCTSIFSEFRKIYPQTIIPLIELKIKFGICVTTMPSTSALTLRSPYGGVFSDSAALRDYWQARRQSHSVFDSTFYSLIGSLIEVPIISQDGHTCRCSCCSRLSTKIRSIFPFETIFSATLLCLQCVICRPPCFVAAVYRFTKYGSAKYHLANI